MLGWEKQRLGKLKVVSQFKSVYRIQNVMQVESDGSACVGPGPFAA